MAILGPGIAWNRGAVQNAVALSSNTLASAPGIGIHLIASVAGTATLTYDNGNTQTVNLAVGDNIYPFSVVKWVTGTATITTVYILY